ncbi:TetR/AcrR family transcriptional regulator [Lentzea nigeriaca]|uniref:TetR/AcrR family transcriptional regulator n=1 Tax=Lentzea nigeriaca TaxID=1128665 RepID=UPI0019599C68|nr:TetR/AcrR family transcriptional regulator [Lentzea nigeriaca]MBM7864362.1 AcrR family transcriptional regulator [Lentzea nigeriaca]
MDRKQGIVLAAFDRIAEKGFEGLRLREVARAVGVDHSTLHHHFATKEDLIAAVVDHATGQFWRSGEQADDLGSHLERLGRMIVERPALFRVLRELDLRAARDPAVREMVDGYEDGWRRALGGRTEASNVELVIALVKGVSLRPDIAPTVLRELERLISA